MEKYFLPRRFHKYRKTHEISAYQQPIFVLASVSEQPFPFRAESPISQI
jgi:hypothetical protein